VERFILERKQVSAFTANKEIRYLKGAFNFGKKKKYIRENPVNDLAFFSENKRLKYVPPPEDIEKVLDLAGQDSRDYLLTIRDNMARVSEVNRLTWDDVNLGQRYVVLYTRKKRGGHLTPRKVSMTRRLYEILSPRFATVNTILGTYGGQENGVGRAFIPFIAGIGALGDAVELAEVLLVHGATDGQ